MGSLLEMTDLYPLANVVCYVSQCSSNVMSNQSESSCQEKSVLCAVCCTFELLWVAFHVDQTAVQT